MKTPAKQIIAVALGAVILGIAYFGSFLPYQKSKSFIAALNSLGRAGTIEEIEKILAEPLARASPIGEEELVRNVANQLLGIVNQQNVPPEVIARALSFVNRYYAPIIERGRGMSFNQNLYVLGILHEIAFVRTGNPAYLGDAKRHFAQGLSMSPKRPQFLYGLLDVSRAEGNLEDARKIATQILLQWKDDESTRAVLSEIETRLTPRK
ncbi:MAG: tetratricopeptide repeat protein [Candidatus Liptonbacteria bacterium]|nr:tetratricopeptide repeat protein [Candidatus Liptonbacteria bacterium]